MRPIELELENFTSFRRRATVNFEALSLFAITGSTGSGKTSILDALGFALYGETPRLGQNGRAELISLGASRLTVRLVFEAGGKRYQVVRILKRAPKGANMTVQLEVWGADKWEPLANKGDVRTAMPGIVGLDFDGFTRSVVLPQGQFDRFLRGDTQARRRILSDLLHLDTYVEMGKRANQLGKEAQGQAEHIDLLLQRNYGQATEETRAAAQQRLEELRERSEALAEEAAQVRELHRSALELRAHRERLNAARQELTSIARKRQDAEAAVVETQREIASRQAAIANLERQRENAGYNEELHLDLLEVVPLARQADALRDGVERARSERGRRLANLGGLGQTSKEASQATAAAASRARAASQSLYDAQNEFNALRERYGSRERVELAISEWAQAESLRAREASIDEALARLRATREAASADVARLEAAEQSARKQLAEATEALEHVRDLEAANELRRHLETGKPCPVCEQMVEKKPRVAKTGSQFQKAKDLVAERQSAVERCASERAAKTRDVELLPAQIRAQEQAFETIRKAIDRAEQKAADVLAEEPGQDTASALEAIAGSLARVEQALETARSACEREQAAESRAREKAETALRKFEVENEAVRSLDAKLEEQEAALALLEPRLKGRPGAHALESQLRSLERARKDRDDFERRRQGEDQALRAAEQRVAAKQAEAANMAVRCVELGVTLKEAEAAAAQKEIKLSRKLESLTLPEGKDEADRLERRRTVLERDLQRLGAEVAVAGERLETLARQIAEASAYRVQIAELRARAELCGDLGRALRADRFIEFVQAQTLEAMAIGGARHLEALSQGQYSFAVRDNEFWVVDHSNAGELRSVQTLSGGEAFLASLALALAMAGSLADLAGGREKFSLESLFLDEGFSTLDPETLDIVVSGIEALAGGERMVGVISHVPELAARMPNRIEVTKSAGGSVVSVS